MILETSKPVWVIGDVQGCYQSLEALLAHPTIQADQDALFCFAGDLINRGPQSLDCVRLAQSMGNRAITLLGNHDIHLLGVAAGIRKVGKSDTAQEILAAPDAKQLLDWLRHCPLALQVHDHLIVHAGVAPSWTLAQTLAHAREVEHCLQDPNWQHLLDGLFGNHPDLWNDALQGQDRLRLIINILTRMRTCYPDGRLNTKHKGPPDLQEGHTAWFDLPNRALEVPVIFGHWSTLGLMQRPDAVCLDTGCVWGESLTAIRLPDRKIVQVTHQETQALNPLAF